MTKSKDGGMKSAYELAMERFQGADDESGSLTAEQKEAIARVDEDTKVRIAELEIMASQRVAEARAAGDAGLIQELDAARSREARELRDAAEREKESIRSGK